MMLSSQLYSTAARAVRPSLLLKCTAARYGVDFLARAALTSQGRQQRFFTPTPCVAWKKGQSFHHDSNVKHSAPHDDSSYPSSPFNRESKSLHYEIPFNVRQKVVDPKDAVALVRDKDTVCVSGFVCQGTPEAVLKALGEKYETSGSPNNLTILFGGGPGTTK